MATDVKVAENGTVSADVYHFKASMKHLTLASHRAEIALQGPYQESVPTADGLRHWKFDPIFDPEAFKIVMFIIHAKLNDVPEKVSLKMLSNIAVVVDDLYCQDSVGFFAKMWLQKLDEGFRPSWKVQNYSVRQIFIASVFRLEVRFKRAIQNAIVDSCKALSSCGLPIAPEILGKHSLKVILYLKADEL